MLALNDGRSELWQWDTGRTLSVPADCSQVHFSNKVFGRSIDVDVVDNIAVIPDVLLQTDKELTAWAFVGTAENGYTKISKVFKVNKRNKPADYVFTPVEQTTLAEIVERLDDIESAQDPDAIKNAVEDYLADNPIQVSETDPTVPEWAKKPQKPTYTAEEVGALPSDTPIPDAYILPVASSTTLGGVQPVAATEDMTQPVGVDAAGALFTAPGGGGDSGGSDGWKLLLDYTLETDSVTGEGRVACTRDPDGNTFAVRQLMFVLAGTIAEGRDNATIYLNAYANNEATTSDGYVQIPMSRLPCGAAGSDFKSTIEFSIFGELIRVIAAGGQNDTSSLLFRGYNASLSDVIRSLAVESIASGGWAGVPFAAGGSVKVYGRL